MPTVDQIISPMLVRALERGTTQARLRRLEKMRGRDELHRLLKVELDRRLAPFVGKYLTPTVQAALGTAIEEGVVKVARLGADA